jgi:hypothetical protein
MREHTITVLVLRGCVSALKAAMQEAMNTYEQREGFLELGDLLFGQRVRLYAFKCQSAI